MNCDDELKWILTRNCGFYAFLFFSCYQDFTLLVQFYFKQTTLGGISTAIVNVEKKTIRGV